MLLEMIFYLGKCPKKKTGTFAFKRFPVRTLTDSIGPKSVLKTDSIEKISNYKTIFFTNSVSRAIQSIKKNKENGYLLYFIIVILKWSKDFERLTIHIFQFREHYHENYFWWKWNPIQFEFCPLRRRCPWEFSSFEAV